MNTNDDIVSTSSFVYKLPDQSNGYRRIISATQEYTRTVAVKWYLKDNNSPLVPEGVTGLDNQRWKFVPANKTVIPVGSTTKNMVVGESLYLSYKLLPGAELVSVESDARSVVSYENHRLYANSPGTATITAIGQIKNDQGQYIPKETTWTIHVSPQEIQLSSNSLSLNVGDATTLTADTTPNGIDITWSSSNTSVATVSSDGKVTAVGVGIATITAEITDGGPETTCIVTVSSADPFHPSNITYARYTRITGENYWGLGEKTDHTISIIKSALCTDEYFIAHDNINRGYTREYIISNDLITTLNNLEVGYQEHYNIIPAFNNTTNEENIAHVAKLETDQLVMSGSIANQSSEYYGIWAYNYTSELNREDYWRGVLDTATASYGVYLSITYYYYSYLSTIPTTATATVSSTQYNNMSSCLDEIDDAISGMAFSDRIVISAEKRNAVLSPVYNNPPPYKPGTPVIGFKTTQPTGNLYVKVSAKDGINSGGFVARADDILGLTPSQINNKFALGYEPKYFCYVEVNSGTQMYVGIAGQNGILDGGGIQYDIFGQQGNVSFGITQLLP